ncbi:N-acetylneuraminate synthase [Hahella sp. KA22]|uniref:N-acetylneuraminate synthase family protein n=1 Tax=Hahella sp. KA22 TaxID=1628392 RepID=UPI000FDE8D42|nr:N-acetylneuraminate synthase family protein [Hahella sp. KA22]AZZ91673.1 N-acetylneuraminate synthase [Hahella sp. KA22]QAY55043.1 N-acetylneuraminate synthase [Hahella sp. KA22]
MNISNYEEQGRTFVIAEIGQAHDGSIGILHSLIDAAASTGADAVKFQLHIADAESSPLEPFRKKFSYVDNSRYEYWKRMELSLEQWREVKRHCDSLGVEFLATPFSNVAVDLLQELGVKRYKVGSGDVHNLLLIDKIIRTGREIILSSGLSSISELERTVEVIKEHGAPFALLQCTTQYPTKPESIGLAWLRRFKERFECPVGLSDHSGTCYPAIGAVALGASVVEAHITFDQNMFGPDACASMNIQEFKRMVDGVRCIEQARSEGEGKEIDDEKEKLRTMFGKSLAVNRDIEAGETLTFADLEGKKPYGAGIPVNSFRQVVGRSLRQSKKAWDFIEKDDLL